MTTTIFVVGEHEGVRMALRQWLEVEFSHCHATEFISAEGALACANFQVPALVIMDMGFSLHDRSAELSRLHALIPDVPIVILAILDDDVHRAEAMQAGAAAFISTRKMHEELIPQLTALLSKVRV